MGTVWRATDLLLQREVAVKLMAPQLRLDPVSWERFRREAQYQAALRHPGITEVYDYGEHEGQPFIVMEFLDGGDLYTLLRENPGGLTTDRAVSLGIQAADALAYLHDSGILHRDIKPANLFIAREPVARAPFAGESLAPGGQLKVCDFGVAKSQGSASITQAGTRLGTWAYLAPEVWLGEEATASTDLYALGCVLHEMLTGRPPFSVLQDEMTVRRAHLQDQVPPARGGHPVPERLSGLISQLLSKEPQARPATARDVAEELRAVAASSDVTGTETGSGSGDGVVALGLVGGAGLLPAGAGAAGGHSGGTGAPAAATLPRTRELPPGYHQAAAADGLALAMPGGAGPAGVVSGAGVPAGVVAGVAVAAGAARTDPVPVADRHALAVASKRRGPDDGQLWAWAARVSAWLVFATMVGLCVAIAAGHLAPAYRLFVLVPAAIYTLPGAVAVSRATFGRPSSRGTMSGGAISSGEIPAGSASSRVGPAAAVFVSLWIAEAAAIGVASHVRPAEAWSAIMVVAWLGGISAAVYYSA
jgi:Protein kinase domain